MKVLPLSIIMALLIGSTSAYYIYTTFTHINHALKGIMF